jgi:hypothetical protein
MNAVAHLLTLKGFLRPVLAAAREQTGERE